MLVSGLQCCLMCLDVSSCLVLPYPCPTFSYVLHDPYDAMALLSYCAVRIACCGHCFLFVGLCIDHWGVVLGAAISG